MKKIKLLTIHDMPLVFSGIGCASKYLCEGLLKTGNYTIRTIGGAMKHPSYKPISIDPWGEDWIVFPKDGYGNKMELRSILDAERPDALLLFTDPRFFIWIWEMADEILPRCPILYWHIWDNYPVPKFNNDFYRSTTFINCLSKLTHNCVLELGYGSRAKYLPHAVLDTDFFPLSEAEIVKHKEKLFGKENLDKFIIFWNNRNAKRKNPSDLIYCMNELRKKHKDILLFMHTSPFDNEGSNLIKVVDMYGIHDCVKFSNEKIDVEKMNILYNIADVTINIAFAEGFGLSSLESIMAGTCIINQKTGGLQDQVDESVSEQDKWGLLIGPDNRTLVGSQQVFYIFEERVNYETIQNAIEYYYNIPREERKRRGKLAREWAKEKFNMVKMIEDWDKTIVDVVENYSTKWKHFDQWRFHKLSTAVSNSSPKD